MHLSHALSNTDWEAETTRTGEERRVIGGAGGDQEFSNFGL